MRGVRIPHDLNGQDRFVLGLSVGNLAVFLFGLLAAYAVIHLAGPLWLRVIVAFLLVTTTLAIVWVRPEGRSLLHWIAAAVEYGWSMRSERLSRRRDRTVSGLRVIANTPAAPSPVSMREDDDVLELPSADGEPVRAQPDLEHVDPVPVYLGGPQVIVFYSVKGGTGRTTLATEVACLLAARGWYREGPTARTLRLNVMLADLDRTSANVSVHVGLAQPTVLDYLGDFASSPERFSEYVVRHEASNLHLLLGSPKCLAVPGGPSLGTRQATELIATLRSGGHHFILIDISSSLGEFEAQILELADRIICVVTPMASAIQDLYRTVEVLRRLGHGPKLAYVANRVAERWDASEPMGDLGGHLVTQVPYDPGFEASENRHEPYVLQRKGTAHDAVLELATFIYPALQSPGLAHATSRWLPRLGRRRRAG
ncbi:MAG TPA: AAA family ATPase [Candidatus Limnocylindrales bacterium]|nr:AAA family ATPase [Candidatus Limnocylindrales bacterium]